MSIFKITLTNNGALTTNGWTSGGTTDSNIAAGASIVRYASTDGRQIGTTDEDRLVLVGTGISDIYSSTIVTTRAQIYSDIYLKAELLIGDREVVIFEHTGTATR